MTSPDPFNFSSSWDQITINSMPWGGAAGMGGKIVILGATRFYKVDQKDGQGLDGATQTFRGVKPRPFKLVFSWWNAQQHNYWALFSYMFIYTGSKVVGIPPVFSVYHPALSLLFISAILVDEVGQVEVNEDTKIAKATVIVRQFYPPPPVAATATPIAAPPGAPGGGATSVSPYAAQNIADQNAIAKDQFILNGGNPATFNGPI